MIYGYKCPACGEKHIAKTRQDRLFTKTGCDVCGHNPLHRDYGGIALQRPVMPHFNRTLGREVVGMRDFAEGLKRAGEKVSQETGLDTDYRPVMPGDVKVTGEGLDSTNAARVKVGLKPVEVP